MSLPQIFNQLVKGYQKVKGIKPEGLDLIKIKQEAMSRFKDMNKVVDMKGNVIDTSKGIMGGQQVGQKGMFDNIFARMQKDMGKNLKEVKTKKPDPEKKAMGGRAGFASGGDYKMRIQEKAEEIAEENYGKDFYDLSGSMQSKIYERAIREIEDMLADQADMMRKGEADGGRIGLKEGEGIMQMASVDDPFYRDSEGDRDEHSFRMFNKPYKELNEFELEEFQEEMMRLMNKFSSAPDPMDERNSMLENLSRQYFNKPLKDLTDDEIIDLEEALEDLTGKKERSAPSITLAEGGRAAFKDGKIAGFFKSLRPFSSKNKYTNQLEGILYGSEGLSEGLQLLSQLPFFAEGGRIGYKDGPQDPKRRTFMKAAAGLASLLPFGIGKGVKMAAPVVAKAAEISGPALAKLVDTVMSAGKLISVAGKRVKEMVTKKKLGKVEVTEDIQDGSYIIKKDGKEIYYKPGRQDESGGFDEDIIEVIEKRIEKAGGGGIGYMLGE